METTLTERGQTSIPMIIRKKLGLRPGQKMHWEIRGPNECRLLIDSAPEKPNIAKAIGFLRKINPQQPRSTDTILRELREGEEG